MVRIKSKSKPLDWPLLLTVIFLLTFSAVILSSVSPGLFPVYYIYYLLTLGLFFLFRQFGFQIVSSFPKQFYIASIIFLVLPLLVGQVTRGAVRWLPLGALTIQPTEIVRPFLIVFFSVYLAGKDLSILRLSKAIGLLALPVGLILLQPSLGVSVLTIVSFVGVLFASTLKKKFFFYGGLILVFILPLFWFLLAPYQQTRILTFVDPSRDPYGAGYNAIQSTISVGAGGVSGRGLGKGVQTQLSFLPERHSDFIFASVAEEMGFVGSVILLAALFFLFWRMAKYIENSSSPQARAYVSGFFLVMLVQSLIHVGMNMGIFPITGLPLPLVSAGGSSLLATSIGLGILVSTKK